jgi:hypothetical protein
VEENCVWGRNAAYEMFDSSTADVTFGRFIVEKLFCNAVFPLPFQRKDCGLWLRKLGS